MGVFDALKGFWNETENAVKGVFQEGDFQASFELNGETKTAGGNTALEALENVFEQYPQAIIFKTRGKLTLECEGKKSEQLFFGIQMRRLMRNYTVRQIWAKRMGMMMK